MMGGNRRITESGNFRLSVLPPELFAEEAEERGVTASDDVGDVEFATKCDCGVKREEGEGFCWSCGGIETGSIPAGNGVIPVNFIRTSSSCDGGLATQKISSSSCSSNSAIVESFNALFVLLLLLLSVFDDVFIVHVPLEEPFGVVDAEPEVCFS